MVMLTGELPGVWHQLSADEDQSTLRSAGLPSASTPLISDSSKIVVAGFLVTETNVTIGSMPSLWESRLPMKGSELIGQFGLKSVAVENAQSSSMHLLIGSAISVPRT